MLVACRRRASRRGDHTINAPDYYDGPELYSSDRKILDIWDFLQNLDRPEIRFVDASRDEEQVYSAVRDYLTLRIT